jgi:hypothetical protein
MMLTRDVGHQPVLVAMAVDGTLMFDATRTGRRPVSRMRFLLALFYTVAMLSSTATAATPAKPAGMLPLETPLPYNGEWVDVSHSNTLLTRYASKNYADDLAFYLKRANAASAGGKPGVIHIREVFIRHIDVVIHPNGQTLHYDCNIPPSFITEAPEYEKLYSESMFAASNGALRVEFTKPLVISDTIVYDRDEERNQTEHWWFAPYKVRNELKPYLRDMKPGSEDYLFFFLDTAYQKGTHKLLNPQFGGMAYADEEMNGSRFLTINDHELARGTHEMGHHLYDTTVQETEGMTVTRFHGMQDAGYFGDELWKENTKPGNITLGPVMAYYRDCMRYYITRDMWERWRLHGPHNIPHEPFSGKAYAWMAVKSDFWFKLPQLTIEPLRKLTDLKSLVFSTGEAYIILAVDPNEPLQSARLTGPIATDCELNNAVNFKTESAAVLKTTSGIWLFVKPQLVDVYVDMLRLRGKSQDQLPVYGYVLEDQKALVVLKLPADESLPQDELGFFKPSPAKLTVTGLLTPGSHVFSKSLVVKIEPHDPADVVRYTLDDSNPTTASTVYHGPIELNNSAILHVGFFKPDQSQPRVLRAAYEFQPLDVQEEGLTSNVPPLEFRQSLTLRMKCAVSGASIHYTMDGFNPTIESAVFVDPIVITKDTIVKAQCFDPAGHLIGRQWSASYFNYGFVANLATDKPVLASSHQDDHIPENAVSGKMQLEKGWYAASAPQWLQVDLLKPYLLDRARIFTYWDGSRYYQYRLETSVDGKTWVLASDMSQNTTVSTSRGQLLSFSPRLARYVKITMLKNSANPGQHVIQLRVFQVGDREEIQ